MDARGRYKNPALAVNSAIAQAVGAALQEKRLLDSARKIRQAHDEVIFPLLRVEGSEDITARFGARLLDDVDAAPRAPRETPAQRVRARLAGALTPDALALVPDKWEKLGDVVVLRLPDALLPHALIVAEAFADVLHARTVLRDAAGVTGELREMRAELLVGDDAVTTHVEDGVRYRFDASRVMFSSGNVAERQRAGRIDATGETVIDMFAGIGYFTLPVALRSGAARVIAIEKNPVSFRFLQENVRENGVEAIVEPWLGDNRAYPQNGVADRVLMGYFPGTAAFIPTALRLLKPEGGRIHYHDTAPAESWRDELAGTLLAAAAADGREAVVEEARVVKSYAPGIVHAVIVASVRPRQR